jgi:hypothetical protein
MRPTRLPGLRPAADRRHWHGSPPCTAASRDPPSSTGIPLILHVVDLFNRGQIVTSQTLGISEWPFEALLRVDEFLVYYDVPPGTIRTHIRPFDTPPDEPVPTKPPRPV